MPHPDGLTAAPPPWGAAEIVVLIPPVFAYAATPCSWYCHRLCSAGCQQAPLHAAGDGSAALAGAAVSAIAISDSAAGAALRRKRMFIESSSSDERNGVSSRCSSLSALLTPASAEWRDPSPGQPARHSEQTVAPPFGRQPAL